MFHHDLGSEASLRLWEETHAAALFAVVDASRAHLRRWLPWLDMNTTSADSLAFIRATRRQVADNQGFQAGIWQGERLVGAIGFHHVNHSSKYASVGYWLAADAQGHGLVTRATQALVDQAFGPMGLNRVEIRAAVENRSSRAVLERLGFVQEGVIRDAELLYDHFVDHVVYATLARDWPPKNSP